MSWGRGRKYLLVVLAGLLASAGTAQANVPSATWQRDALEAAESYWHYAPPWDSTCQMTVSYVPLGDPTEAGETDDYCNVVINSSTDWLYPDALCLDVTHEVGHVVLGPDAFPGNPSDPAHSTDPSNIMYPVIFDARTAQCTAMLNKEYPPIRKHHRRHRHRRFAHGPSGAIS